MAKRRAVFFSVMVLMVGFAATAVKADRCQEISNRYFEQYSALAKRRLQVGREQPTPSPPGSPEYCRLTRQMLSVATEWVSATRKCGGEWQTPAKLAKGSDLIRTAQEQVRVACP